MDYRRVDGQLFCHDVEKSKKELLRKLGGRVKNHYEHIKNRNSNLNTEFLKIYGFCCVYCGLNSRLFNSRTGLEVDHFICESSFKTVKDGKEIIDHIKAGNINNLVSACSLCNRRKSNLIISNQVASILNIDQNLISNVFMRDNRTFKILIKEEYKNNKEILKFYNKLNLGSDLKRLEYLGLKIDNIINTKAMDNENKAKLQEILLILIRKHNITYDIML